MEKSLTLVPVLTIDGPSGAGKGAVSSAIALRLGWNVLDSGAVYRAVALAAIKAQVDVSDSAALIALSENLPLAFRPGNDGIKVSLAGAGVGDELRTEAVSVMASRLASDSGLRRALLQFQRDCRQPPGLVADGRDMGTVVFPDAGLKIFLEASVEERARRRYKQLKEKGESVKLPSLFQDMLERDRRDRERAASPTLPAPEAVVVDSTRLTLAQVVEKVLGLARERFA